MGDDPGEAFKDPVGQPRIVEEELWMQIFHESIAGTGGQGNPENRSRNQTYPQRAAFS